MHESPATQPRILRPRLAGIRLDEAVAAADAGGCSEGKVDQAITALKTGVERRDEGHRRVVARGARVVAYAR